jgi:hypothetical protein
MRVRKPLQTEDSGFNLFWAVYPKRVARLDAMKAWKKLDPNPRLVERILAALEIQKHQESWQRNNGQFIPYAATWIRGERWEDEYDVPVSKPAYDWFEECKVVHGGACGLDRYRHMTRVQHEQARARGEAG